MGARRGDATRELQGCWTAVFAGIGAPLFVGILAIGVYAASETRATADGIALGVVSLVVALVVLLAWYQVCRLLRAVVGGGRAPAQVAPGEPVPGPAEIDAPAKPEEVPARPAAHEPIEGARAAEAVLAGRRAVATWILVGVCVAVYGLQELWGGAADLWTSIAMGAVGVTWEPWRIFASAFLHASPTHLLFNMVVLVYLGRFLERVLGTPRFLVLFAAGAFGGGLACFLLSGVITVGASGGLWGLLVAMVVLAFRGPQLPDAARGQMKRVGVHNLALNVMVSFAPGISLIGHLGGGLAGAALAGSGLLLVGRSFGDEDARRDGPVWWLAGGGAFVVMVCCLGLAIFVGKPWTLKDAWTWERHVLPGSDYSIELPGLLSPIEREQDDGPWITYSCGDLGRDRAAFRPQIGEFEPAPVGDALFDRYSGYRADLEAAELPDGLHRLAFEDRHWRGGLPLLKEHYSGVGYHPQWFVTGFTPGTLARLWLATQVEFADGAPDAGVRILESLEGPGVPRVDATPEAPGGG